MNYRRAKGLCYKCGQKWSPRHKCATSVPLHVVEELWQMLHVEEQDPLDDSKEDSGDDLMALSIHAVQGTNSSKTVRMVGNICGKEVIILIDSRSTHNFISESLASRWRNWSNHQCRSG